MRSDLHFSLSVKEGNGSSIIHVTRVMLRLYYSYCYSLRKLWLQSQTTHNTPHIPTGFQNQQLLTLPLDPGRMVLEHTSMVFTWPRVMNRTKSSDSSLALKLSSSMSPLARGSRPVLGQERGSEQSWCGCLQNLITLLSSRVKQHCPGDASPPSHPEFPRQSLRGVVH